MKSDLKNNIIIAILILNLLLLILLMYNYYKLNKNILLKEDYTIDLTKIENDTKAIKEKLENLTADANIKKNITQTLDTLANKYIVKNEDTLEKIAFEFYKNRKRTDILIKQNNLQSKWDIKPGQVLEIPKLSE